MESDDTQAAPGQQPVKNGIHTLAQCVQFAIHRNAKRLKCAPRRVLRLPALCRRHGSGRQLCQLRSGMDWSLLPGSTDPARNLPGIGLLAIFPQNTAQFFTGKAVHKVCRCGAGLAHAHIQRRISLIGKPPRRFVQLMAGHAKVQQRAVQPRHAGTVQSGSSVAEIFLYDGCRQPGQPFACRRHGIRVLIQADQAACLQAGRNFF